MDQEQLRLQMEMEAEEEAASKPALTEHDGVKRMELHATPKELPEETPVVKEKPGFVSSLAKAAGVPTSIEDLDPKTTAGAFAHGVSKGATFDFGDEITGALGADTQREEEMKNIVDSVAEAKRKGTFDPSAAAPEVPGVTSYTLKRPGMPDSTKVAATSSPSDLETPVVSPWKKAYQGVRDDMRKKYKTAETEHPVANGVGQFMGAIATPVPGTGKAKGLAKVGKYAATGAGIGAIAGLGDSEADLTEGEFSKAASDTEDGALAGGLFGGALGGVAARLDPWLEKMAARRGFKALDPYMKTIMEELGPDATKGEVMAEAEKLGRRALDENIIPGGKPGVPFDFTEPSRWANSETLAERALEKTKETGAMKGGFVDASQDALSKLGQDSPVSLGRLATKLESEAQTARLAGDQKLAKRLDAEATEIRQTIIDRAEAGLSDPAAQSLQEAEKFKTGLQKQIDYGSTSTRPSVEAEKTKARFAKEQAENAIEAGLGPEDLDQFKALKNRHGEVQSISNIANYGAMRDFRNNAVGLGDKIAGQAGAAAAAGAGGPAAVLAGAAAAGGHHFANHRGSAGLARTLRNASERMSPLITPGAEFIAEDDEDRAKAWAKLLGQE